jgi:putative effector of murein hydrolase LrgA (UPF0299 family)
MEEVDNNKCAVLLRPLPHSDAEHYAVSVDLVNFLPLLFLPCWIMLISCIETIHKMQFAFTIFAVGRAHYFLSQLAFKSLHHLCTR